MITFATTILVHFIVKLEIVYTTILPIPGKIASHRNFSFFREILCQPLYPMLCYVMKIYLYETLCLLCQFV